MALSEFELVNVQSGVRSLRSLATGEVFHPVIGPMREARELHVEQQSLRERARQCAGIGEGGMVIWDVGLGAAANAIAAIEAVENLGIAVEIHSFDKTIAPLEFAFEHAEALEYPLAYRAAIRGLLECGEANLRRADGSLMDIRWQLHLGDFTEEVANGAIPNAPDAVFYDPYSPKRNPEMWTVGHLKRMREHLTSPCLGTTYTRSTAMRVTFLLAGFFVGRGTGIGEKDETTLLATAKELLRDPLTPAWLERVQRSSNAAPLRDAVEGSPDAPIAVEDMIALRRHPQFSGEEM